MNIELLFSSLSLLGIGGVVGAYIKHLLDKQKELNFKLNELNENKYRSILVFMSFLLNPKNKNHFLIDDRHIENLNDKELKEHLMGKLEEYYYHSLLYASDDVIRAFKKFLKE